MNIFLLIVIIIKMDYSKQIICPRAPKKNCLNMKRCFIRPTSPIRRNLFGITKYEIDNLVIK